MDDQEPKNTVPVETSEEWEELTIIDGGREDGAAREADSDSDDSADAEEKDWLFEADPPLGETQFGLRALFSLTAACGCYFLLERIFQGQFALHTLGGIALTLGLVVPLFWVVTGFMGLVFQVREPFGTLLLIGSICGAVLFGLFGMFGF